MWGKLEVGECTVGFSNMNLDVDPCGSTCLVQRS